MAMTTFRMTRKSKNLALDERALKRWHQWVSDPSWFRRRLSMMGLMPSEEAYLYASFIRALNMVVSRRLSSIDASGTTNENASSPTPFMTGPPTQPTLSDISPNPGDRHRDAK